MDDREVGLELSKGSVALFVVVVGSDMVVEAEVVKSDKHRMYYHHSTAAAAFASPALSGNCTLANA